MDELFFLKSERGNKLAVYEMQKYTLKKVEDKVSYYRCTLKTCNAWISIDEQNHVFKKGKHVCLTEEDIEKIRLKNRIRETSITSFLTPKEIVSNELSKMDSADNVIFLNPSHYGQISQEQEKNKIGRYKDV